ncbi:MAG: helix-turn-helix transcriptional regulator [Thaumarchaeota archaeon]|nr:helix-turn-helix transcriptional regulator [Nitrososphaerota archaeon]
MQIIQNTRRIDDDERKEAILGIVSDRYCRQILYSTIDRPKSVMEISYENKIPISTVYRRIQTLHDNKLVGVSGLISSEGKKYFLYKSKVKAIMSSYDGNQIEIKVIPNIAGA